MSSRDQILTAVKANQPPLMTLPALDSFFESPKNELIIKFTQVLSSIGGSVIEVEDETEIGAFIREHYPLANIRAISPLANMQGIADRYEAENNPHKLENVELAILPAHFAVAENGACWLSETLLAERVLPFITQHLILVVNKNDILPTMHEAYQKISDETYGYGTFIAGPSKTADIEQSLVLGAHGARSLLVFLV
ncbi:LutC/YkgG family protein [Pedobacter insulae]|uniref:L-lactate dehydrogenase complex protein LldG n=1 Tax=Pedobacter insulae TaxID=414048 RepID=A0A1I2UUW5_9SPHI|nr:LUD domain-containing protein [Pedobacter insulae]SFG80743.1 L-lactate dehydrogenase complex protein LldG [Pedobacter insulae]